MMDGWVDSLQWGLAQVLSLAETRETSCEKDMASQSLLFSKEPCNNSHLKLLCEGKSALQSQGGEIAERKKWS